jgi:hypothetical protein
MGPLTSAPRHLAHCRAPILGFKIWSHHLCQTLLPWGARHVSREYDHLWSLLGNRQIEELIDLPLMTNQDVLDVLDVFTEIVTPALRRSQFSRIQIGK